MRRALGDLFLAVDAPRACLVGQSATARTLVSAIRAVDPCTARFAARTTTRSRTSRPVEEGGAIRRRRQCNACGARFTTFERIQLRELTVIKRDGRRVPFDREKFKRSIMIATRKRGIDEERIERLVNGIVREIEITGEIEINAKRLGALAMQRLAGLDQVAYVRFASVYRDFTGVKDFEQFIARIGTEVEADDAAVRQPDDDPAFTALMHRMITAPTISPKK